MQQSASLEQSRLVLARDERRAATGLYRRASRGELARVRPGVYAPALWWEALRPHERYRHRVIAAGQVFPDAIFMRESAAALHGLPGFGEPRDIHILDPGRRTTKRFGEAASV